MATRKRIPDEDVEFTIPPLTPSVTSNMNRTTPQAQAGEARPVAPVAPSAFSRGLQGRSQQFVDQQAQPSMGSQAAELYRRGQLGVEDVRGVAGQAVTQEAGERFRSGIQAEGQAMIDQERNQLEQERMREQGFADTQRELGMREDSAVSQFERQQDIRAKGMTEKEIADYNQKIDRVDKMFQDGQIDEDERNEYLRQVEAGRLGVSPVRKIETPDNAYVPPAVGQAGPMGGVVITDKLARIEETGEVYDMTTGKVVREPKDNNVEPEKVEAKAWQLNDKERTSVAQELSENLRDENGNPAGGETESTIRQKVNARLKQMEFNRMIPYIQSPATPEDADALKDGTPFVIPEGPNKGKVIIKGQGPL